MSLDHLWAGWRSSYVATVADEAESAGAGREEAAERCVFCRLLQDESTDASNFVVHRGPLSAAVLNAFPYTSGHLLVMPTRHVREPDELTDEESEALWRATWDAVAAIRAAYGPDGAQSRRQPGAGGGRRASGPPARPRAAALDR